MRDCNMSNFGLLAMLICTVAASVGFARAQTSIPQAAATTCAVMSGQRKLDSNHCNIYCCSKILASPIQLQSTASYPAMP